MRISYLPCRPYHLSAPVVHPVLFLPMKEKPKSKCKTFTTSKKGLFLIGKRKSSVSQSSIWWHPAAIKVVCGDIPAKLGAGKFTGNHFCCLIILDASWEDLPVHCCRYNTMKYLIRNNVVKCRFIVNSWWCSIKSCTKLNHTYRDTSVSSCSISTRLSRRTTFSL